MTVFEKYLQDLLERKKDKVFTSYHEAYAHIQEEVDELWQIVKLKSNKRDHTETQKELADIAFCVIKMAEFVSKITK